MHPAIVNLLRLLEPGEDAHPLEQHFFDLAQRVAANAPSSAETSVSLRKLLEAKDAALRAS